MKINQNYKSDQGIAMVLIMIVLAIATAIGIWALSSSRSSMTKAGTRKFSAELTYQAEQGLQKAVRRFQSIAENTGGNDMVAAANSDAASTGDLADKKLNFLTGADPCEEKNCGGGVNQPCGNDFNPKDHFDERNKNVICNFLGVSDMKTQVSVVRKDNLTQGGSTFSIYLVNSIAKDSANRKQVMQGVVVVPHTMGDTPHLASSKAVTE